MGSYQNFKFVRAADDRGSILRLKCSILVCDANDNQSQCALGCQRPSRDDPEYTELTDDEIPDEDEEFEQVEEIQTGFQYVLEEGSLDGENLIDVANNFQNEFKVLYGELNPFNEGVTTVKVNIEMEEVDVKYCEATEINTGETVKMDCDELDDLMNVNEENGRKRRGLSLNPVTWVEEGKEFYEEKF